MSFKEGNRPAVEFATGQATVKGEVSRFAGPGPRNVIFCLGAVWSSCEETFHCPIKNPLWAHQLIFEWEN